MRSDQEIARVSWNYGQIVGPKPPKHKAVGWMTGTGGVTTHNPAQSRMEIRDAGDGRRELRTAE